MKRYRLTLPNGSASGITELNPAAVVAYLVRGYAVEYVGPSNIIIVEEG